METGAQTAELGEVPAVIREALEIDNLHALDRRRRRVVEVDGVPVRLVRRDVGAGVAVGVGYGARLTSGFGMRRHPLLGYSKMHAGVDFGVPQGTPIRAAGSGVVKIAGRHGAFGIAVEIKHNDRYETLYAHMSKLAAGIRRGTKVNQGQIIGYVGSTGRSTGPHLHYEVHVDDRPVNPTRIKAAGGKQLAGKELMKFNQMKQRVVAMMQQAPSALQVAQAKP